MKLFRKISLSAGALLSVAPIATVVACSEEPAPEVIDYSLMARTERFFEDDFYSDANWESIGAIKNDTTWESALSIVGGVEEFQEHVNLPIYTEEDDAEYSIHLAGVTLDTSGKNWIIIEAAITEDIKEDDEDGKPIIHIHNFYWKIFAADFSQKLSDFRDELSNKNKLSTMTTIEIEEFIDTHDFGSRTSVEDLEDALKFQNKLTEKLEPETVFTDKTRTYYFPSVRVSRLSSIQKAYSVNFSVYSVIENAEGVSEGAEFEFSISFTLLASDIGIE